MSTITTANVAFVPAVEVVGCFVFMTLADPRTPLDQEFRTASTAEFTMQTGAS